MSVYSPRMKKEDVTVTHLLKYQRGIQMQTLMMSKSVTEILLAVFVFCTASYIHICTCISLVKIYLSMRTLKHRVIENKTPGPGCSKRH